MDRWKGKWKFWGWFIFFIAPFINVIAVERLNGNFITDLVNNDYIDNYVICLLLYLLIFALSGSLRLPVWIASPLLLLFGVANMYVKEFKGGPLLPMDLKNIGTAATVAGGYTYHINLDLIFAIAVTIALIVVTIISPRHGKGRIWWILRGIALAVTLAGVILFYCTNALTEMGYKPDFFNENRGYQEKGAVLEFTLNTRYLWLSKPEGYDASKIPAITKKGSSDEQILSTGKEKQDAKSKDTETKPNIIVIMDESFSDLRTVGDFETTKEVMPFIDSLSGQENVIDGNAYVSILGTGTSNTEYEFLTGDTMAFLPMASNAYQIYVKSRQPGLTSTLEAQGYSSTAFHPYFGSNWNRESVYRAMGFDQYISMEDLFGSELIQKYQDRGNQTSSLRMLLDQKYGAGAADERLYRQYVSDDYDFKQIEKQYENRDESQPFFLFNVTMQNHSPYDYAGADSEIQIKDEPGKYPHAEQYLTCVNKTDQAFRQLIRYFQKQEEPTIILFFGDHQPNIENEFVEKIAGKPAGDMTDEELQSRYQTKFILWANYDIPEGHFDKISMNYLQALLLQTAGLSMPTYQKYLAGLYQEVPVITAAGCEDAKGNYFKVDDTADVSEHLQKRLQDYKKIAYNNTFGGSELAKEIFYLNTKAK